MIDLHSQWKIQTITLTLLLAQTLSLNTDGVLLLAFKHSILSDPLGVLDSWNAQDLTPCSWQGVTCSSDTVVTSKKNSSVRATTLSLPGSQLLGSIPAQLGMIRHLKNLNLSDNSINGSIPSSLLKSSQLQTMDLSNNLISGELSELAGGLKSLKLLNLSDNALLGKIPRNLTKLGNLTVISLKSNYFSGEIPSSFEYVHVLDLSSNLINGSLPSNFSGNNLHYLNLSYNRISGEISREFGKRILNEAVIDFSFNNFTGQIPETILFSKQDEKSYAGNSELCGKPLKKLCAIPSTISGPPNSTLSDSPPAIAAIPKDKDSSNSRNTNKQSGKSGIRPATIVAIIVGDVVGVAMVAVIFFYVYQLKKNRSGTVSKRTVPEREFDWASSSEEESKRTRACGCLRKQVSHEEESSDSTSSVDQQMEDQKKEKTLAMQEQKEKRNGALVTIDGEKELEIETLLKASAYILGATGSSIMYKAVLEDGNTMAVRRIGENGVERFRDFENQVRAIAKLVHPNLVRIRGFYWGSDEKLVIYDFVPNGSLANARYRKTGSSPCHLPWEIRLKIAKGVARGLTYIHDKKHVHGNLKPSNILLGSDMEPKIGDFGLERLVPGESGYKPGASARNFGSKRSTTSRDSFQDNLGGSTPSPSPSSLGGISPYYAPESLRNIKATPKWDVFSFGVVLLELLTGKVIVSDEVGPGPSGLADEEKSRVLRMADVVIRADLEGREDALLALLKLGFNCLSPTPQKRPHIKDLLQALEKFPASSSSFN